MFRNLLEYHQKFQKVCSGPYHFVLAGNKVDDQGALIREHVFERTFRANDT